MNTSHDFKIAPRDTPVSLVISLWEKPRPENQAILSIITGYHDCHWFEMVICIQRGLTTDSKNLRQHRSNVSSCWWTCSISKGILCGLTSDCDQHKYATLFWGYWDSGTPDKESLSGLDKEITVHKSLLESRNKSFKYCHGPYNDIGIDFQQLWVKTVASVGRFHTIGGQRIFMFPF